MISIKNNILDSRLILVKVDVGEDDIVTFESYSYTGKEYEICALVKKERNPFNNNNNYVSNKESFKFKKH